MKILNNIESSHFNDIKELVRDADEFYIISPYLMESFDVFFDEIIAPSGVKRIVLITTLRDNDPDLFKKANSLYSFSVNCLTRTIAYRIHVDNKLHGKIYIACKDSSPISGIITSANFTDRGLNHNHEWGIQIDDTTRLKQIITDISKVSSHALTYEELHNIIIKIDSFSQNGVPLSPKINLKINNFIKHKVVEPMTDIRYFIKPVGFSDEPFETTRTLSSGIEVMHFSKRRPNSIRIGDILICYGVGTTKLLGYFEVISEPYIWDEKSRWPWEIKAKNLSPKYSQSWMSFENTISSIQASFDTMYPVTYVGGKTLGALQFGADKIRLSEEFANHLLNIIDSSI
ncbi:NgoFVII family restriction endonuclease [Brevibacillus invocatus]|uniref:NgoFVII family restriction endonuclease n=1 Tax=Brevibacillus invocatus TaxID=173959 RepID=A0A3M8C245_9BACL|nr:restriction endonuclease PLD domain-containing protein [Brevibacillus invocatus]RNB69563.1 NgoFVII family restriction endonuclease [Brevibacillus invocatus]